MKKILSEEQVQKGIEMGWQREEVINGYSIFTSNYMSGALNIHIIGEINDMFEIYESDKEASIQAEKDGIRIIHDLPIKEDDYDFAYFIDTIENRKIIQNHLLKRGIVYKAF